MRRTLLTVAFSLFALTANAVEFGLPFEQLDLDRALPNIHFAPVDSYVADTRAPYEQLAIDRALPDIHFGPVEPYVADARAPFEQLTIDRALPDVRSISGQFANAESGELL